MNRKGFTIVELLIVIVVIGILAAITIVAYNGIQERAHQTKTVSALSEYAKAFAAYAVDHDNYPPSPSCLGDTQGAANVKSCINPSGVNGTACFSLGTGYQREEFVDAMKPYLGETMPMVGQGSYSCGGTRYAGGYYYKTVSNVAYFYVFFNANLAACPVIGGLQLSVDPIQGGARMCRYALPAL